MKDWQSVLTHLSQDPVMARLIEKYPLSVWDETPREFFPDMVENILGQQLSGRAAETITNRFKKLYGDTLPTPAQLLSTSDEAIRGCGTSWAKVKYLKNLAQAVVENTLPIEKFPEMTDEEIKAALIQIKGIGNWTAEMMLMSTLRRIDIFSVGDGGLQNAMILNYSVKPKDLKKMEEISLKWSPYRSIACKLLWMSLDNR